MKRFSRELTIDELNAMSDEDIDFSDMPELGDTLPEGTFVAWDGLKDLLSRLSSSESESVQESTLISIKASRRFASVASKQATAESGVRFVKARPKETPFVSWSTRPSRRAITIQ